MEQPTCVTCPHWSGDPEATSNQGHCLLNPPQVVVIDDEARSLWPRVYPDEWCGQHPDFAEWLKASKEE